MDNESPTLDNESPTYGEFIAGPSGARAARAAGDVAAHARGGTSSPRRYATDRQHLGCISAVSRPYLGRVSAVSRACLGRISGVSRADLGYISRLVGQVVREQVARQRVLVTVGERRLPEIFAEI